MSSKIGELIFCLLFGSNSRASIGQQGKHLSKIKINYHENEIGKHFVKSDMPYVFYSASYVEKLSFPG